MCVTIKRACFHWCGMIKYSALVNSVFLIINVIGAYFFRFKLDFSLYIPHVHDMAFSLSNTQLRLSDMPPGTDCPYPIRILAFFEMIRPYHLVIRI